MPNRTKDWLGKQSKTANRLDKESRAALVREVFTAIATVAFLKWMDKHCEEWKNTTLSVAEVRARCFKELEVHWPEFQATSANSSDDQLYAELQGYTELAEAMGPKEWRVANSHDQQGQARHHEHAAVSGTTRAGKMLGEH